MHGSRVLIVEDDTALAGQLRTVLAADGADVEVALDLATARDLARSENPDLVLLDFELPDGNALDLLPILLGNDSGVAVIVLTGHGEIELAVACIKAGAQQFLTKPVELSALRRLAREACEQRQLRRRDSARAPRGDREIDPFVGRSDAIRELERRARVAASAESPILILGETGTGKGVLARWLHAHGNRAREPFVDLNCAALSRELLDSELFGHARGAFTGAVAPKAGLFEVADRGTLFLDEIGDADPAIQGKILKAVEEKSFRRLGETHERRADVRLVAATHRDLGSEVESGRFRADLYYRLNTLTLSLPPLRDRMEDFPALVETLLGRIRSETGRASEPDRDLLARLRAHDWRGNIRELANMLERIELFGGEAFRPPTPGVAETSNAPQDGARTDDEDGDLSLETAERRHIERVLTLEGGRVEAAAERLGVPRSTLYQRIKQHRIDVPAIRRGNPEVQA